MNGEWIRQVLTGGFVVLGMASVTGTEAAGEALSLSIGPALAGATTAAVIKVLNPADVEAFSLELTFASGQTLSLSGTGWFTRGAYFPVSPLGPAPAAELNNVAEYSAHTRVFMDGFNPTGATGSIGSVTFRVAAGARPAVGDVPADSQVLVLSGKFWSRSGQREVTFLPVTAEFTVAVPQDTDGDGVPDATDNCPTVKNPTQTDSNANGVGDACEGPGPVDTDHDGLPDATDTDDDNDAIADTQDNCPLVANANQADTDRDGIGDACDPTPGFCWQCLPDRGGWRAILKSGR